VLGAVAQFEGDVLLLPAIRAAKKLGEHIGPVGALANPDS